MSPDEEAIKLKAHLYDLEREVEQLRKELDDKKFALYNARGEVAKWKEEAFKWHIRHDSVTTAARY